jgi:type III restriction enzyme
MAEDGSAAPLGIEESKALWEHLKQQGYIDAKGKVQDALRAALKVDKVMFPESMAAQADQITQILRKLAGRLEIKNADERRHVRPRQAILDSSEFKALWDRIKYKTTYRVEFDNEKLIENCIQALREAPAIPKTRLQWRKADLAIGKAGVEATEREGAQTVVLEEADIELPDLLTVLQDRTQLTIHRAGRRGHQPPQAPGRRGRHQVPAPRRRALLRPGTLRAGGADRLPQEHAHGDAEVSLRAGGLRLGHGSGIR